jgi:hypothetical protein
VKGFRWAVHELSQGSCSHTSTMVIIILFLSVYRHSLLQLFCRANKVKEKAQQIKEESAAASAPPPANNAIVNENSNLGDEVILFSNINSTVSSGKKRKASDDGGANNGNANHAVN